MNIFPAIDLYGQRAVRLYQGDYNKLTVYNDDPLSLAKQMESEGAKYLHLVDLEGAKDGTTPHLSLIKKIAAETSLFVEIGGGIRTPQTVKTYLDAGINRVILGTAAVRDRSFLENTVSLYQDRVAVGVDIKDGFIAISGWQETASLTADDFMKTLQEIGVCYVICTDISKDGAMLGTNRALYRHLSQKYDLHITASGGVSSLDDIVALNALGLYGAIIGKAYYTGALTIKQAQEAVKQ
ncbi:MAG: 1-(5-phosphoribosyl)-5-[(5-phosphoribosylamino)methylideneamino]imidazole-4-carboxamide isomerase [Clostridia bacterium]|nr:1-(5-phosphoribosyl)-5-[(5-phosphoribosylamino)methylideneamino]imidazole-4-carboxamide isomerase [Clostridia bacterium]